MNLYSHFYYFLIWGHGLKYTDNIIQMIENVKELAIRKIVYHNPKSMSRFIKQVYSYDYAPLSHLKGKTRYLKKTPRRVLFIFVENYEPNEVMYGEGEYLHRESTTIKALKESIRDKYNDRKDDFLVSPPLSRFVHVGRASTVAAPFSFAFLIIPLCLGNRKKLAQIYAVKNHK